MKTVQNTRTHYTEFGDRHDDRSHTKGLPI